MNRPLCDRCLKLLKIGDATPLVRAQPCVSCGDDAHETVVGPLPEKGLLCQARRFHVAPLGAPHCRDCGVVTPPYKTLRKKAS